MNEQQQIRVGDGATICFYTDRKAATVTKVRKTKSGRLVVEVQTDTATRTDNNGMSEIQYYEYSRDPNGQIYTFRENKNKQLVGKGGSPQLFVGFRREYYDYSF